MKIHRWIISLVFCCCVTFLSAQILGTEITVVVSPDHTDWKYVRLQFRYIRHKTFCPEW